MNNKKLPGIAEVIRNPSHLKDIKNPSFDTCIAALMQDGLALKHVPASLFTCEQYYRLCLAAVKSRPKALTLIQRECLTWFSWNIVQNTAVNNNGLALRWLKEQSPELCLAAIKQTPKAFVYVDKAMCDAVSPHCYKLLKKALLKKDHEEKNSKKKQKLKPEKTKEPKIDLRSAEKQTEALCLKAVRQDGLQLRYVWKQTRKLCLEAIRQKPAADDYVRDSKHIGIDDIFDRLTGAFGDFSSSFSEYVFCIAADKAKKIPVSLKKSERQNQPLYYRECVKALEKNVCNIRYIKPELLSNEQFKGLCLLAIKEIHPVLHFINKADISAECYFDICLEMVNNQEQFQLEECFSLMEISRLSRQQYYRLVQTALKVNPERASHFIPGAVDAKKLGNKNYYAICKKLVLERFFDLKALNLAFLTRAQYYKICLGAVKKQYYNFDEIDRCLLEKKDWLNLCKMVLKKNGKMIYHFDITGIQRKKMVKLALRNGGGLGYIKKQAYNQCMEVLKKNGSELEYVRPQQFTREQYFELCKNSIENEANALSFVDEAAINNNQYRELCAMAIKSFPGTIRYVNPERIPPRQYLTWCRKAVNKSPYCLDSIYPSTEAYYELCLKAVKKDEKCLEYVKYLWLSPEQYKQVRNGR